MKSGFCIFLGMLCLHVGFVCPQSTPSPAPPQELRKIKIGMRIEYYDGLSLVLPHWIAEQRAYRSQISRNQFFYGQTGILEGLTVDVNGQNVTIRKGRAILKTPNVSYIGRVTKEDKSDDYYTVVELAEDTCWTNITITSPQYLVLSYATQSEMEGQTKTGFVEEDAQFSLEATKPTGEDKIILGKCEVSNGQWAFSQSERSPDLKVPLAKLEAEVVKKEEWETKKNAMEQRITEYEAKSTTLSSSLQTLKANLQSLSTMVEGLESSRWLLTPEELTTKGSPGCIYEQWDKERDDANSFYSKNLKTELPKSDGIFNTWGRWADLNIEEKNILVKEINEKLLEGTFFYDAYTASYPQKVLQGELKALSDEYIKEKTSFSKTKHMKLHRLLLEHCYPGGIKNIKQEVLNNEALRLDLAATKKDLADTKMTLQSYETKISN